MLPCWAAPDVKTQRAQASPSGKLPHVLVVPSPLLSACAEFWEQVDQRWGVMVLWLFPSRVLALSTAVSTLACGHIQSVAACCPSSYLGLWVLLSES